MIYQNFQAYSDTAGPVRAFADLAAAALAHPLPGMSRNGLRRAGAAICELVVRARLNHHRAAFEIDTVDWLRKNCAAASGLQHHHLQTGVGHYGVFAGRRWSSYIYPILRNVFYASD